VRYELNLQIRFRLILILRVRYVLWLRLFVAGLSPRRPGFDPRPIRLSFVVEKVSLRPVLLLVLRFFPFDIIPPVLHTHLQLHVAFNRTKMRNQTNTAESNALSNIEEHWIEKNFHVIFVTAKAGV